MALFLLPCLALATAHTGTPTDSVPLANNERFPSAIEWTPESGGMAGIRVDETTFNVIHVANEATDQQDMAAAGGLIDLLGGTEPRFLWQTADNAYWVGAIGQTDASQVHASSQGPPAGSPGETVFDSRKATNLVETSEGAAFGVVEYVDDQLQWTLIKEGDPWISEAIATFDPSYRFPVAPTLVVDTTGVLHMIGTYANSVGSEVDTVGVHAFKDDTWTLETHPTWSVSGVIASSGPSVVAVPVVLDDGRTELHEWDGSSWVTVRELDSPSGQDIPLYYTMAFVDGESIVVAFNQERSGSRDMHVIWTGNQARELNLPEGHQGPLAARGDVALLSTFGEGGVLIVGVHKDGGPVATFSNTATGTTRRAVEFESTATLSPDRSLAVSSWSFGTLGGAASHVFSQPGRHYVTLTVTDDQGDTDTATGPVDIIQIGPDACIMTASTAKTGEAVSLSDCSSHPESDLDAEITSRAWVFGDGEASSQTNPSHTYDEAGTYTISLTVTDEQSATDTASKTITVSEPSPNQKPSVAVSFTPESPIAGQEVTFTATASDSDGSIAAKAWTVDGIAAGRGNTFTQTFEAGAYSVAFTATDDDGESTTVTKNVIIEAPAAPEISLDTSQITDTSGQEFEVTVTVRNPNLVPVTVDLSSDAPDGWEATFSETSLDLEAGKSMDLAYTITPPYTAGGLTIINIEASIGDATDTKILRTQLQVGEAPAEDTVADPVQDEDPTAPLDDLKTRAGDSGSGVPVWVWFVGGGAVVLAGVGATLAIVLRKP